MHGYHTSPGHWTVLRSSDLALDQPTDTTSTTSFSQPDTFETPTEYHMPKEPTYLLDLDHSYNFSPIPPPSTPHLGIGTLNINSLKYDDLPHIAWLMKRLHLNILTLQDTRTPIFQRAGLAASWKTHMGPSAHISFSHPDNSPIQVGGQIILSDSNAGLRKTSSWEDPSNLGIIHEQCYDCSTTIISVYYPASSKDDGSSKLGAQLIRYLKDKQMDQSIDQYIWSQISPRPRRSNTNRVVVTGDWNQNNQSLQQRIFDLGLSETIEHQGVFTYYKGPTPSSKIDHIWSTTPNIGAGNWDHPLWQLISDHRPLWIWLPSFSHPLKKIYSTKIATNIPNTPEATAVFQNKTQPSSLSTSTDPSTWLQESITKIVQAHKRTIFIKPKLKLWCPKIKGLVLWYNMLGRIQHQPHMLAYELSKTEQEIKDIGKDGPDTLTWLNHLPNTRNIDGLTHLINSPFLRNSLKREYKLFANHLHTRKRSLLYSQFRAAVKKRDHDPYLFYKALGKPKAGMDLTTLKVGSHTLTVPRSIDSAISEAQGSIFSSNHQYEYDLFSKTITIEGFLTHFPHEGIPHHLLITLHRSLHNVDPVKKLKVTNDLQSSQVTPTLEEFQQAIKSSPSGSAAGPSGLSYLMLKKLPPETIYTIHKHLLTLFSSPQDIPLWLNKKTLFPLPKIDGPSDLSNIRPIVLIETLRKLWCRIIIFKVNGAFERAKILQENQYGFRPGRSCSDALIQLTNALEEAEFSHTSLVGSSLDIKRRLTRWNVQFLNSV